MVAGRLQGERGADAARQAWGFGRPPLARLAIFANRAPIRPG